MRVLFLSLICSLATLSTAKSAQTRLQKGAAQLLQFDDIDTKAGWGDVPSNYSELLFGGFLAFRPDDPALEERISKHDLNCAASAPNALYGTRYNSAPLAVPAILLAKGSRYSSFEFVSVKIKPLNMPPLGYTKLRLRATRVGDRTPLDWDVDFPHGFHDMFTVKIHDYSGSAWDKLQSLWISADFVYNGPDMDWEFCLDDLEILLES